MKGGYRGREDIEEGRKDMKEGYEGYHGRKGGRKAIKEERKDGRIPRQ